VALYRDHSVPDRLVLHVVFPVRAARMTGLHPCTLMRTTPANVFRCLLVRVLSHPCQTLRKRDTTGIPGGVAWTAWSDWVQV